jgi:hypothetical protein
MAQWEAKFDWPRDQFLHFRVQWPPEPRVKCENRKLKRGSQLEFETLGMVERRRQNRTRKIKGRTKTSQLQDELPEWVHRGRGVINEGKPAAAGEKVSHPPAALTSAVVSSSSGCG